MGSGAILEGIVVRQEEISSGIFSLLLEIDGAAPAYPGQFFNLYTGDNAHLLPRPISIAYIDNKNNQYRFVYQVKGFGTKEFTELKSGGKINVMGPLGNGFPDDIEDEKIVLVGGGMGVAPLLPLANIFKDRSVVVLGYRDTPFLKNEFSETGAKLSIATETGIEGTHGNVIDVLQTKGIQNITCLACGPTPMLKALCRYSKENGLNTYISLEERMACGLGACLGCVTNATEENEHYRVKKLCVCKDGPVFNMAKVII